MPTYVYACEPCDEPPVYITKPMAQAAEPEPCPICRRPMERIWTPQWVGKFRGRTPKFWSKR